jgi:hypothetical protein
MPEPVGFWESFSDLERERATKLVKQEVKMQQMQKES